MVYYTKIRQLPAAVPSAVAVPDRIRRRASPSPQAMTQEPRILFVHIPKTGGISLFSSIASAVGEGRAIRFADASKENREKFLAMSNEEVRRYRLVSGHFPLAIYLKKDLRDYQVITVLRNAVDRELSAYYYMKGWKAHPRHEQIGKMDLLQYV